MGSHRDWRLFFTKLVKHAPHVRVHLVDLRHHGESRHVVSADRNTLFDVSNDVNRLIMEKHLSPDVILGHSYGGKVATILGHSVGGIREVRFVFLFSLQNSRYGPLILYSTRYEILRQLRL